MNFIMMPVPEEKFEAVCAVLSGKFAEGVRDGVVLGTAMAGNIAVDPVMPELKKSHVPATFNEPASKEVDHGAPDVDAHGHPWNPDLHAPSHSTTKDGLWRMKKGAERPDPMPGFPKDESGAEPAEKASLSNIPSVFVEDAGIESDETEDDEFAAFTAAVAKAEDTSIEVPARKWTDADMGALTNQAAQKTGDPAPIKALIAEFTPEGEVPHSRNIPAERREDFAKALQAKVGFEFAG